MAARLGAILTLNLATSKLNGKEFPSFRGEWRWEQSNHLNNKDRGEITEIRGSRGRKFWDISVEDEPHLFALSSGVLTHNCKPNPMPESVTDRCTKAHEYIFLLSKSQKYFFDHEAIKEPAVGGAPGNVTHKGKTAYEAGDEKMRTKLGLTEIGAVEKRNKRSVWSVNTKPYKGAHFAVYPEKLIEPCILAGSKFGDIVFDPFMGSGTTAAVAIKNGRQYMGCELNPNYGPLQQQRIDEATKAKPPIIDGDPDSLFTFGDI
jgi:adenine specific DNA methylase Mod